MKLQTQKTPVYMVQRLANRLPNKQMLRENEVRTPYRMGWKNEAYPKLCGKNRKWRTDF